ncbi:MAG: nucleotidyltransferase family protein [Sphingomonas adhaesiva]|uniref:nucleotidyltransferase family protein n=1 Tax=Sphingomonas adhaesiva TaxID=28212 RepID=UPI002FFA4E72
MRALALPDAWIGAGFVRDAVWDALHGRAGAPPAGDVDVVWHDPVRCDAATDRQLEGVLRDGLPAYDWSVKNQARMHERNGDARYRDVAEAMRAWPETATAVAVRLNGDDRIEINAPYGLDDLFALVLRPTAGFVTAKRGVFDARVAGKAWLTRYPRLRVESKSPAEPSAGPCRPGGVGA